MAKRRNLKKEKAERNLANARQYRKRFNPHSSRNKRFNSNERQSENEQTSSEQDSKAAE